MGLAVVQISVPCPSRVNGETSTSVAGSLLRISVVVRSRDQHTLANGNRCFYGLLEFLTRPTYNLVRGHFKTQIH